MFNKKKPRVSLIPRVSYDTAEITGRDGYYPLQVTVSAGTGVVWENPTCGIPVRNPNYSHLTQDSLKLILPEGESLVQDYATSSTYSVLVGMDNKGLES